MLIDQNMCFVANPKTGSTSIISTLQRHGVGRVFGGKHISAPLTARNKHWTCCAVVRNPFDRLVSGWAWATKSRSETFSDWLRSSPWIAGGVDFKRSSQAFWVNSTVNHTIRFEDLHRGWSEFLDKCGLPDIELQHDNRSERPHYREVIGGADKAIIEDRFAFDLIKWGYSF